MIRPAADRLPILIALLLFGFGGKIGAQASLSGRIRSAQESNNYGEAARLYLQLISEGTDTPEIRSNCGVMLHLAGRNREALQQFQIALRRNPDLAGANLFAGLSLFDLGEPKTALPYLQKAQELDPSGPAPVIALGKANAAIHDYGRANEFFAKATSLDSNLADAWYGLGVTSRSLAEEILNKAARSGTIQDTSTKEKVQHYLDGAVQALTRAAELEPNSARTHLLIAESLSESGRLVDALPEYQTALKLDPGLDAANLGLASAYWKQRQFDQALPLLKRILSKTPKDAEANAMMADILEHNGDNAAAQHYAETALANDPNLIQTRVVLARVYLSKQQPKLAIAELRRVIAADPDGSYHFLLYRAYRENGDERAAKEAMAEFQKLRYSTTKP